MAIRYGATLRPEQIPTLAATLQALGEADALLDALRARPRAEGYEVECLAGIELSHTEMMEVIGRRRERLVEELARMNIAIDTAPVVVPQPADA